MASSTSSKDLSNGDPSSSTSHYRPSPFSLGSQSADEESAVMQFTLHHDLDDLFSCALPSTYSDTTDTRSDLLSITPSSSASQTLNDDPNNIPNVPGDWGPYYEARRTLEDGQPVYKFFCVQPGCPHKYARTSGPSTLSYHIRRKHRSVYMEYCSKKDGGKTDNKQLQQTTLTMASVPKQKRDKIYTATLEWLIGDLLPSPLWTRTFLPQWSGRTFLISIHLAQLRFVPYCWTIASN